MGTKAFVSTENKIYLSGDAIGQVHIKYAKRGCADADAVSSCENKVNSDEVSTINSLTDSLKVQYFFVYSSLNNKYNTLLASNMQ